MAPLPQNSTARYILKYTNGLDTHDFSIRYDDTLVGPADAAITVGQFFTELASGLPSGFAYISARYQPQGATFTLPTPVPILTPSVGAGSLDGTERPAQIVFSGRTAQGRNAWITYIGVNISPPTDWTFDRGDNPVIDDVLDYLQGLGSTAPITNTLIGIDGQVITWYDRATFQYNDYWVRKVRP